MIIMIIESSHHHDHLCHLQNHPIWVHCFESGLVVELAGVLHYLHIIRVQAIIFPFKEGEHIIDMKIWDFVFFSQSMMILMLEPVSGRNKAQCSKLILSDLGLVIILHLSDNYGESPLVIFMVILVIIIIYHRLVIKVFRTWTLK